MQILVVNSGSSSIKFQLRDLDADRRLLNGTIERIGESEGATTIEHGADGEGRVERDTEPVADHVAGFRRIVGALEDDDLVGGLTAFGHRVVHGGDTFVEPALIDDGVVERIRELVPLAPLHNPANLAGIEAARALRGDLPHVAVFDTAFHRSMPVAAERYAIPLDVARTHGVRRYGFHGTSHAFVAHRAAGHLGRDVGDTNLVTLHLGNGASAAAIRGGRCVDTSMGLSPLEGLVMGTRSGDLDPMVVFHLVREGMDLADVETMLNRRSGLLGLCGANDLRVVEERAADGDGDAAAAIDVYCHRIRRYVGAFVAVAGPVHGVVFTAGVGENSPEVRRRVCEGLDHLGIVLDEARNAAVPRGSGEVHAVHADGADVAVLVVPTDEELEIALQTRDRIG